MKRMHIHIGVDNIDHSVKFYSALFGVAPTKSKPDYAKWMLDDPSINLAISTRVEPGIDHVGLHVEEDHELTEMRDRLTAADMSLFDEGESVCCYARADKSWVKDPSGVAWEAYKTLEDVQLFTDAKVFDHHTQSEQCCAPAINANNKSTIKTNNSNNRLGCCG